MGSVHQLKFHQQMNAAPFLFLQILILTFNLAPITSICNITLLPKPAAISPTLLFLPLTVSTPGFYYHFPLSIPSITTSFSPPTPSLPRPSQSLPSVHAFHYRSPLSIIVFPIIVSLPHSDYLLWKLLAAWKSATGGVDLCFACAAVEGCSR